MQTLLSFFLCVRGRRKSNSKTVLVEALVEETSLQDRNGSLLDMHAGASFTLLECRLDCSVSVWKTCSSSLTIVCPTGKPVAFPAVLYAARELAFLVTFRVFHADTVLFRV